MAPVSKKQKITKPEGYPKRPVSAFIAMMNEKRPEFLEQVDKEAGSVITQVSKFAKAFWDSISDDEKGKWTIPAAEALKKFNEDVKKFNEDNPPPPVKKEVVEEGDDTPKKVKKVKKERPLGTPKRTPSAFILYSVAERSSSVAEIVLEGNTPSFGSIASKTSAKWKAMSDADKESWKKKATDLADIAKKDAASELEEEAKKKAEEEAKEAEEAAKETPAKKPVSKKKKAVPAPAAPVEASPPAIEVTA